MTTELFSPEQRTRGNASTDRWRLLLDGALDGAWNMAVDEALLESVIEGGPPAIRFYAWQPYTLSLGVNQPAGEINREECAHKGFGLVRRPTGGRAVLHQYELTYSVVAPESDARVSGGVVASYRKISEALVDGLRLLGADVELAPPSRELHRALTEARRNGETGELAGERYGAVCFDAASDYELTSGGRKLVGSAQARRGGAILQHGSILLDVDFDAWAAVFAYRTEAGRERARAKLPMRMTSLREALRRKVDLAEVVDVLRTAFEQRFEIQLEPESLGQAEEARARTLALEKYGDESWTGKK